MNRVIASAHYPIRPLGAVAEFLDSRRVPVKDSKRLPGPYPYYGANGQVGTIDGYLFDEPLVLLAEDGGFFDAPHRGIAYAVRGKTWVNNHAHVLRPREAVDLRYLFRVLENYDVTPFISGTTRSKLTQQGASRIPIPLPPLSEQGRIAAILDQADAVRLKRNEALEKADATIEAVFRNMFDAPGTKWPEVPISDLATNIRTGPFGSQLLHSEFKESGIAVLGIDNAVQNKFVWARPRYINERKFQQLRRYAVHPGDVLITIMGTCGRCAVVPQDIPTAINTKHLCCISLDQARCLPAYLHSCFLMHPSVLRRLGIHERGAVMPGLNMQIIKELPIPLPPLHLQGKFSSLAVRLESGMELRRESFAKLNALFQSLQYRAFRGEL